jgi:hypothetical protein
MTFDEHGAMRIVPVHSQSGSSPANPRAPFEAGTHFHPMLARFQHHFAGQPFTVLRNAAAAPLVSQPASTPPVAVLRQPNPLTDDQQGEKLQFEVFLCNYFTLPMYWSSKLSQVNAY